MQGNFLFDLVRRSPVASPRFYEFATRSAPHARAAILFSAVYLAAFVMACLYHVAPEIWSWLWCGLPAVVGIKMLAIRVRATQGIWEQPWREVVIRTGIGTGMIFVANLTLFPLLIYTLPRKVIATDAILTVLVLAIARMDRAFLRQSLSVPPPPVHVANTTWASRVLPNLAIAAAWAIAVFFPIRMCLQLASVGEDSLGYDYIAYLVHFDQMFAGDYQWWKMPIDSLVTGGSHCLLVPRLLRLPILMFTDWSQHVELAVGVGLAVIKVGLLMALFSRGCHRVGRAVLLAMFSGLVFALSHFEAYQFGPAAMNQHCADVIFLLGCLLIVHKPRFWVPGLLLCGWCAAWSYGSGVFAWPAYGLGLLLTGEKRWRVYLAMFVVMLISASPYVIYRVFDLGIQRVHEKNWFAAEFWVKSLSLVFFTTGEMDRSRWIWMIVGTLGLASLGRTVLLAVLRFGRSNREDLAPFGMLIAFSLPALLMICFSRNEISPWYSSHYAMIWCGILGGAFLIGRNPGATHRETATWERPVGLGWVTVFVAMVIGGLLFPANRTIDAKTTFLPSRSPAALTAMREFRTAPTNYAHYPYPIWRANHDFHSHFAMLMERNGWSAFGTSRLHFLQGEFGLNTVQLHEDPEVTCVGWIHDRTEKFASYTHFTRLNLLLRAPNALTWKLQIPEGTKSAIFRTAITSEKHAKSPTECVVRLTTGETSKILWRQSTTPGSKAWEPCHISLADYAGQTVELRLETFGHREHAAAVWHSPQFHLELTERPPVGTTISPSNVDPAQYPPLSDRDRELSLANELWICPTNDISRKSDHPADWMVTSGKTRLDYNLKTPIKVREFSHWILRCSFSHPDHNFHSTSILLEGEYRGNPIAKEIRLPFLSNDQASTYSLDLRKFELPLGMTISKIAFFPGCGDPESLQRQFCISQMRFVHRGQSEPVVPLTPRASTEPRRFAYPGETAHVSK